MSAFPQLRMHLGMCLERYLRTGGSRFEAPEGYEITLPDGAIVTLEERRHEALYTPVVTRIQNAMRFYGTAAIRVRPGR